MNVQWALLLTKGETLCSATGILSDCQVRFRYAELKFGLVWCIGPFQCDFDFSYVLNPNSRKSDWLVWSIILN